MFEIICDFTALAGKTLLNQLDREFQYQMELTDGEWVLWHDTHFKGRCLEPATDIKAQAILQYFAHCACPFSLLRLARSMSPRNAQHGPIVSDELSVRYLLQGLEIIDNNLYDDRVRAGMHLYINQLEFRLACELLVTYQKDMKKSICPNIQKLVQRFFNSETEWVQ